MPTSVPGSRRCDRRHHRHHHGRPVPPHRAPGRSAGGFTLVELLVVLVLVALSSAVVTLALRDSTGDRLDAEAERLSALLEMARAESRVTGVPVRWVPVSEVERAALGDDRQHFRFVGLGPQQALPTRWLHEGTGAQVAGAPLLLLGPEAILPPQRVVLFLQDRRLDLVSDGLGPFRPAVPADQGVEAP
jgi:general secretion pathway protein H